MKESIPDDIELFLSVKNGDPAAFDRLFKKYYPRVLNIVYRFLGDSDEAEDIAQDIFLRVYRGARRFVPQSKFSTWLYRVTVNRCFSHYKRFKREQEKFVNEAQFPRDDGDFARIIDNSPSPDLSPADHALNEEKFQEVKDALDTLPPDQKMALILREYEGFSYKEIALMSGSTVKAVERRIYHARQHVKGLLTGML